MTRKWKITAAVWLATLLFFFAGSHYQSDADLFLIVLKWVLLAASTIYAVVAMIRSRRWSRGLPRSLERFAADE